MSHYVYLPLAEISIDGGTQARAEINMATVAEYADALSEGEKLPPALVFFDGAKHHLADGFHRFHANAKIGAVSMECEIRTGTRRDAVLFSVGANESHGLRRCSADKQKSVMTLLADPEWSKWSDRAIAKECKVGHNMVSVARGSLSPKDSEKPAERTYTTKHGTTAKMNVAGQKAAGKERAADEYDDMVEDDAPPSAGAATSAAESQLTALRKALEDEGAAHLETLADNTAMAKVFEASDPLATAMAENKQLRAEVASLRERVNGLMGEKNAAIRAAESWKRKAGNGCTA